MKEPDILLVGAGNMAIEYSKVMNNLGINYITIGRGEVSAIKYEEKTGKKAITGGIEKFLNESKTMPEFVIVAVGVEQLKNTIFALIKKGIKNILAEKPGGIDHAEISSLYELSKKEKVNLLLAYNRRFYASVRHAKEIISSDGGVLSFNFEFTEWSHVIGPLEKAPGVKEHWFLANSTHVADLAFFLGGMPEEIHCFQQGRLPWHPAGAIFGGAGRTINKALFTYQANWIAPGRWAVEILTNKHRLIFKPLEKLHIQKIGSVTTEEVKIDDSLDKAFKPGLYLQTQKFLEKDFLDFCTIDNQNELLNWYDKMCRYED